MECAGPAAAWAESTGFGAASGQQPHAAFHTDGGPWRAVFAEQYFQYPGFTFEGQSPGSSPGPFSAIGPETAFFLDTCSACGAGTVPAAVVTGTQQRDTITKRPDLGLLTSLDGLSFSDSQHGWATGQLVVPGTRAGGTSRNTWRIVATSDGGRTWRVQLDGRH